MLNYYENDYAVYELKASLLYITYKEGLYIDYEAAQTIVQDRLRFQSYTAYPVLCDVSQVSDISSDAREYLAIYGSTLTKIVALVSSSPTLFQWASYFISINQPKVSTRVFHNLEEAETFLKNDTTS